MSVVEDYVPQVYYLKRRDTRATLTIRLRDPRTPAQIASGQPGDIHDLTGATSATLHVYLPSGEVFSRAMESDFDASGIVSYEWAPDDWTEDPALVVGTHRMEVEVKGPSDARLTFPNCGWDVLRILADLGQA